MNIIRGAFLCLLTALAFAAGSAQTVSPTDTVQRAYEQFDYQLTIRLARQALTGPAALTVSERQSILTLKAAAEYSIGQEDSSQATFQALLGMAPTTTLDANSYSPKIVEFFEQVKRRYTELAAPAGKDTSAPGSGGGPFISGGTIAKSILVPGWGQLSLQSRGARTKGWILVGAGTAALAASIYYIVKANNREADYLSQTDRAAISAAYDNYNSAYTARNVAMVLYASVWVAAQIDLLYFNEPETRQLSVRIVPFSGTDMMATSLQVRYDF